mgnify:CR=1 FL=1
MSNKFNPNYGMCVLKPLEESEQKYGAIILPNLGDTKAMQARIEEISPIYNFNLGVEVPPKYKVGDIVLYPALGASKVVVDREEYIICGVQDLLTSIQTNE